MSGLADHSVVSPLQGLPHQPASRLDPERRQVPATDADEVVSWPVADFLQFLNPIRKKGW